MSFILFIALAIWCWCCGGPRFLRWPVLILVVLVTSGHELGSVVSSVTDAFAGPVLTLLIVFAGIAIILRGAFSPRRRPPYQYWERRWHRHDRW